MMEGLLRALRAAHDFAPQRFLPLVLRDAGIGWVRRERVDRLRAWPGLFRISGEQIQLQPAEEPALSAAFAQVAQALAREGAVRGWRGETYAIRAGESPAIVFHLERAATRFFGLTSSAAHLNGFFLQKKNPCIWIARRAATKAIDPGMLDTLVAGGVPSGEDPRQALLRECGEEAAIPEALARGARPSSVLRVRRDVADGLHSEILHAYDLALPADFKPRNTDGEVSEFLSLDARTLVERIARGEMTVEAGLVVADFALRGGALADESGEIRAAIDACRLPTPI